MFAGTELAFPVPATPRKRYQNKQQYQFKVIYCDNLDSANPVKADFLRILPEIWRFQAMSSYS